MKRIAAFLLASIMLMGCSSQSVPPAHKGQELGKTGVMAFYSGNVGFSGPVVGPGTYYTGMYDEYRDVDCTVATKKEAQTALTKDGVQFNLDIYVQYSANCDDDSAIKDILTKMSPGFHDAAHPDWDYTIFGVQLYDTYIHPVLSEAVREAVSGYIANDINNSRDEIFKKIKLTVMDVATPSKQKLIKMYSLNLANLDFPDQLEKANVDRATQSVLKDTAIAQRERVLAEIETAKLDVTKADVVAQAEAKKIDVVGAALHRNPEYYVRDVYYYAADKGGSVMLPANPNVIMQLTPKTGK